jgi:hypothetical protein
VRKGHVSKPGDWKLFPPRVLKQGIKVEYEHTPNYRTARRIATDHLVEMGSGYYTELAKMERKLKSKGR